jgi:glutathione synthase
LLFTGIDVIGDFMTELNVTSPTGIRELERATSCGIAAQLLDCISSKLK